MRGTSLTIVALSVGVLSGSAALGQTKPQYTPFQVPLLRYSDWL